jgi:hypothetical protein
MALGGSVASVQSLESAAAASCESMVIPGVRVRAIRDGFRIAHD